MLCPKCNTKLTKNENYCIYCGTKVNSTKNQSKGSSFSSNKNHKENKFSLLATIFGPFYLIYKRIYKQALIMILIYITTHIYLPENIGIIIRLSLNVALGFKINNYDNQETTKKGTHGSIWIVLISAFLYILLIVGNRLNDPKNQSTKINDNIYSMQYKRPVTTIIIADHNNYKHYTDNTNGTCSITITGEKTYLSEKEYYVRNKMNDANDTQINIKEEKTKNITWFKANLKSPNSTKEIYLKQYNKMMYTITFESFSTNSCEKDKKVIIESVQFQ